MFYIHKYEVSQKYGGPEEGGWWYDSGAPTQSSAIAEYADEDSAYDFCRKLNAQEHERAKREEDYGYTSVLAYNSTHYAYRVSTDSVAKPFPAERPHYG